MNDEEDFDDISKNWSSKIKCPTEVSILAKKKKTFIAKPA